MPKMLQLVVDLLHLDLNNYRTVHQRNENHAINAMIAVSPDRFWALMDSLLKDGYHSSENIILLETAGKYVVKEGNRRIAALKIISGKVRGIDIPNTISDRIKENTDDWKKNNKVVPCLLYKPSEEDEVTRVISLIHAKGEKAGRDQWTAVAKARYSRDQKNKSEPGLDLLEKYLKKGKNLTSIQMERWCGDYPITVLDEAIQKLFVNMGYKSTQELSQAYPKKHKTKLDKILYDIGIHNLGYKEIRDKNNYFGFGYGLKDKQTSSSGYKSKPTAKSTQSNSKSAASTKSKAQASNDPRSVYKKLKCFQPRGKGRDKLVTLLGEIKTLKINKHPHSFCFLLRSMFELSAKAYCTDYKSSGGPIITKPNGEHKALANLLRDITNHITKNNSDKEKVKELHGAITEIAKPSGILSVTSMNQLVHNSTFSINQNDISILFGNIFPLLEEMNK